MTDSKALSTLEVVRFSWTVSGGWKGLLRSFEFWLAVVVWGLTAPFWLGKEWPEQIIGVVPNLLGFTLGGFAIFLGFGSDEFKTAIAGKTEGASVYLSVSAAFINFIVFQLAALIWAMVALGLYVEPPAWLLPYKSIIAIAAGFGGAIGYFLFCLSLTMVFRAAVRIFRLSRWYRMFLIDEAAAREKESKDAAPTLDSPSQAPESKP